jgi:voltage-gated sodium channel
MNKIMARGLHQLVSGEAGQPRLSSVPDQPNGCYRIVHARWFQRLIIVVILLAGAIIGVETSPGVSPHMMHTLHVLDRVVLGIFVVEMVLKMGSFGRRPWRYFHEGWNVFDFIIVAGCLIPAGGSYVAVLRLFRLLRVLRLLTAVPKLQQLVTAMLRSLPSMAYVCVLLGLLFYIYAVMGVMMFGRNDPVHFGTLGRAMLTLFGVVTLENWVEIMNIQRLGSALFVEYQERMAALGAVSQAMPAVAVAYFVSFVLVGTMVMLNLLIGVIINGMDDAQKEMLERELEHSSGGQNQRDTLHLRLHELKEKIGEIELLLRR